MAITRLQQARQMFRYGGDTMGGPNDKSANTGGGGGNTPNPHTDSGFSKASTSSKSTRSYDGPGNIHSDNPNAPEAYEIIGGTRFDVTPETRKERELAKVKAQIMKAPISNITPKGIEYFKDGIQIGFAPEPKQFGILDLALIAASAGS